MANVQINGILVGSTCVVLSILTTNRTNTTIYYKESSKSDWSSIRCNDSNSFFRESAWEVDLKGLKKETSYDLKASCGSVETRVYNFTTEYVGDFGNNYIVEYCEYDNINKTCIQREPTSTDIQFVEGDGNNPGIVSAFVDKLKDIGFNISYFQAKHSNFIPSFHIVQQNDGWAGLTTGGIGGDCYFHNEADMYVLIHEYRHCFYFHNADDSYRSLCGNAKSLQPTIFNQINQANNDNGNTYYKVFSFFSVNGNKTEPYCYYGENSCDDDDKLYDYFILKLIALNPITIIN